MATEYVDKNGNICLKLRVKNFQPTPMKKENSIKNIMSIFFDSWNYLFPRQERKENVKGNLIKNTC